MKVGEGRQSLTWSLRDQTKHTVLYVQTAVSASPSEKCTLLQIIHATPSAHEGQSKTCHVQSSSCALATEHSWSLTCWAQSWVEVCWARQGRGLSTDVPSTSSRGQAQARVDTKFWSANSQPFTLAFHSVKGWQLAVKAANSLAAGS
jgi:hypothetical protein